MHEEKIPVTIEVLSPLHLASGRADVNVDMDIVHDRRGLPYFPGRRFKGLLYESAVEVAEMMELAGLKQVCGEKVEKLFRHRADSEAGLIVRDFHLPDYEEISREWDCLLQEFSGILRPEDVLEAYTSLRSQTALEEDGTAKDSSLRTMRVLDLDKVSFAGDVILQGGEEYRPILALALQNLTSAGGRRQRGFGKIRCHMPGQEEIVAACLREAE